VALTLIIGNKNYSSWSMRAWLAMKVAGLTFAETRVLLDQSHTRDNILRYSPTGRVPCLIDATADNELRIWDSLAICEYVNETYAGAALWPAERSARARARAVVAEMHSGFPTLRANMPMDIRAHAPRRGAAALAGSEVAAEVERIRALWSECLQRSGGPLLFGAFSIADAFYAPVVMRFATYAVPLAAGLQDYCAQLVAVPAMQQWIDAARAELEVLPNH